MRDRTDVESRVRDLLSAELDRRVKEATMRLPHRCVYNHPHQLDTRKDVEGAQYNRLTSDNKRSLPVMGLCMYGAEDPETWPGNICDDVETAKRCPYFTPILSKETLWEEFTQSVTNPAWVRDNLPDVHALLWVLEGDTTPSIPWWKRLWFRLRRIELEPPAAPFDPDKLLPPAL